MKFMLTLRQTCEHVVQDEDSVQSVHGLFVIVSRSIIHLTYHSLL